AGPRAPRVPRLLPHLVHGVFGCLGERVDQLGVDVGEHHLIARLVQQQPDEASPNVACAEVDRLHQALTSPRMSRISSALDAFSRASTSSSSEKTIAIFDRMSR